MSDNPELNRAVKCLANLEPRPLGIADTAHPEILFAEMSARVHRSAVDKGFWPENGHRSGAELIALIHSELSEALEALRHGNPPDDHIPEFTGLEAELADVVIRVMDFAEGWDLRLTEAIIAKVAYNETRPPKHGKEF